MSHSSHSASRPPLANGRPQGYGIRVDVGGGFEFEVSTGSGFSDIDFVDIGYNVDTWYTVEVMWGTDNTFDLYLYNPDGTTRASLTDVSDPTHTSQGGVAYEGNTRTTTTSYIHWDDFRITSR